jgi:F-type H+-transporting ATPase subunit delta
MRGNKKVKRTARGLFRLCLVDGMLSPERIRQVARALASSRHRGSLRVLSDFQRLVRLERDRHTALVESATPLAETLRDGIQSGLARTYGNTLEMSFGENPALIGGIRIRVGSDVYDGSIRAKLTALASRL